MQRAKCLKFPIWVKHSDVNSFTGTVIDTNKQLETKVSGSGGGGAVYQGSGAIAPVKYFIFDYCT